MKKQLEILKRTVPVPVREMGEKWVDQIYFHRKIKKSTPVFIYQMGKVGSTSIYRSLRKQYPGVVLHSHKFSPRHQNPVIRRLYRWAIVKKKPLKIISLTREPISRNISAFFENFERDTGVPYEKAEFSIEKIKSLFLSNYAHEIPLKWFDDNIMANFGIDVFATPFPESGICVYSDNVVDLLVMRLEINDKEKIDAIKEFVGLDRFQLQNTNISANKTYSMTYKDFKTQVKLPAKYVDEMCESKYFNHFYSRAMVTKVSERWRENEHNDSK